MPCEHINTYSDRFRKKNMTVKIQKPDIQIPEPFNFRTNLCPDQKVSGPTILDCHIVKTIPFPDPNTDQGSKTDHSTLIFMIRKLD